MEDLNINNVNTIYKMNMLIESGDPSSLAINNILKSYGLIFDTVRTKDGVSVVKEIIDAYNILNIESFKFMLKIIVCSFNKSKEARSSKCIRGLTHFLKTYSLDEIDTEYILHRLSRPLKTRQGIDDTVAHMLIEKGKTKEYSETFERSFVYALVVLYNFGKETGRLDLDRI